MVSYKKWTQTYHSVLRGNTAICCTLPLVWEGNSCYCDWAQTWYIVEEDFELLILHSFSPKCWDYRQSSEDQTQGLVGKHAVDLATAYPTCCQHLGVSHLCGYGSTPGNLLPATSASSSIYRSFHLRVIVIVLCLIRLLLVVIRMQIFHDRPQRTWIKTWATGSQANTLTHLTILDTGDMCSTDLWLRTTIILYKLRLYKQIQDTFQITIST